MCKKQTSVSQLTESEIISLDVGCIVEAHESTRQRLESSLPKDHEDHIAGKGFTSMSHYNFLHKFIPMTQEMKILHAKAAVDNECKKLETIPAGQLDKVKSKIGGYSRSTKRQNESPHGTQFKEVQRQSRAPSGHCKRFFLEPMQFLLNKARLRPKWLLQKSWTLLQVYRLWRTSSWCSICSHM